MELAVETTGDGAAVVMVHGLGGTSNTFQPLMHALAGYRVIRPDLAGSGRSDMGAGPLSIERHAEALGRVLTRAGGGRAHVVGHSMGTLVCQHLAATRPDLVASLVLFGALTEPSETARRGLIARAAVARADGMSGIADQIIAATLATRTQADNPAAVAFVRETILRQPPEGYARNCEALARAGRVDPAAIRAPTLLVTGDADPVAPVSIALTLCDGIAGAALTVLDRCGHWVTVEDAGAAARLTVAHLARHGI